MNHESDSTKIKTLLPILKIGNKGTFPESDKKKNFTPSSKYAIVLKSSIVMLSFHSLSDFLIKGDQFYFLTNVISWYLLTKDPKN